MQQWEREIEALTATLDTPEAPHYHRHRPAPSRSLRPVTPPPRPRATRIVIAVPERDLARLRGRRGHPWREWLAIVGTLLLYGALAWVLVGLVLPIIGSHGLGVR